MVVMSSSGASFLLINAFMDHFYGIDHIRHGEFDEGGGKRTSHNDKQTGEIEENQCATAHEDRDKDQCGAAGQAYYSS